MVFSRRGIRGINSWDSQSFHKEIGVKMKIIDHDDMQKLHQYHMCIHNELEKLEKNSPEYKYGSNISKLTRKVVELSAKMVDEQVQRGAKVNDPISKDSIIWLLFANMILLIAMTAFIVNMHNSILDLESKVFPTGRMFTEEGK